MIKLFHRLPPSVIALLVQAEAFALSFFSLALTGAHASLSTLALMTGVLAALLSYLVKLAPWWLLIQLLFLPSAVLLLTAQIPPDIFLGLFLLMLLVYWSTFRSQVPLYLSSYKVWQALEDILPDAKTKTPFKFVDLGCGLGGVITHLAKIRPDGRYYGVELAPLPFLWSWIRIRFSGYKQCQVRRGSLWDCDLSGYDVVFAYLSPAPMAQLWQKAQAEMRPGTVFVSSTFAVPTQKPHKTIKIDDLHKSTLLVWRM